MNKKAFTLAEVLITLGIIGVVAAVTIPTLISRNQKIVTQTKLKAQYATLSSVLNRIKDEQGESFTFTDGSSSWSREKSQTAFETYMKPYLKIDSKYSNEECDSLSTFYPQGGGTPYTDTNGACYRLMKGEAIIFWAGKLNENSTETISMSIVLNPEKRKKIIGKDVFSFAIINTGTSFYLGTAINIYTPNVSREELKTLCATNSGRINLEGFQSNTTTACTELIRRDSWTISQDYPIKF